MKFESFKYQQFDLISENQQDSLWLDMFIRDRDVDSKNLFAKNIIIYLEKDVGLQDEVNIIEYLKRFPKSETIIKSLTITNYKFF